jgi:hypothetical protein
VDTTKEQKQSESGKKKLDPNNPTSLTVDFRVHLPLDTDLTDPTDAYVRINREMTALLTMMRQHFDIRFEFRRGVGIDWHNVPLDLEDF